MKHLLLVLIVVSSFGVFGQNSNTAVDAGYTMEIRISDAKNVVVAVSDGGRD